VAYLAFGGTQQFKSDTNKTGLFNIQVSGKNLKPMIDALQHYEGVILAGPTEREKALCSIISKCNKWLRTKSDKLANAVPDSTVMRRRQRVQALLNEAVQQLNLGGERVDAAISSYEARKTLGTYDTAGLSHGYANERAAYLVFGKQKSLSGTLIDELMGGRKTRTLDGGINQKLQLSDRGDGALSRKVRKNGRTLVDLSVKDWQLIENIAREVEGHQLEVKFMTKHERLRFMLESDGAGGLQYAVGPRSANSGGQQWPYAIDEYGNLYTADDRVDPIRQGYGMFNHSSFTAGDNVVCAGCLNINAAGRLVHIDSNSGHYKPTRAQLKAAVAILRDDYQVDLTATAVASKEERPGGGIAFCEWNPGHALQFLNGDPHDQGG